MPELPAPEATTVMALRFAGGVVMVGDRQATEGYSVAHRRIQKVFASTSIPPSRFPARLVWRSRWCGCSKRSWNTTRRSKACA